jgi:hypothetical protein
MAPEGISTHWLRHTTLTWVERHFSYGVARAYADHTGPATTTYIKADLHEVATTLAAMTGQPHPSPNRPGHSPHDRHLTRSNYTPAATTHQRGTLDGSIP